MLHGFDSVVAREEALSNIIDHIFVLLGQLGEIEALYVLLDLLFKLLVYLLILNSSLIKLVLDLLRSDSFVSEIIKLSDLNIREVTFL